MAIIMPMAQPEKQAGFTIVELLIIIILFGVLAIIIVTTFTDLKQKERNSERRKDVKAMQVAIEGYYAQNGKYPTLSQLNNATWRHKNVKTLSANDLKDPKAKTNVLADTPAANIYSYAVKADDGTACDNSVKDCTKYTFTATYEGGGTFFKNNLN